MLVIFAQVAGPILSTITSVRFFDAQAAKAAGQKERQAEARNDREVRQALGNVEFNPHANPLEMTGGEDGEMGAWGDRESAPQSPKLSNLQAPVSLLSDSGVDSDLDTLSDFVEERIGTSHVISDTDFDGLPDNYEVSGFLFGGQRWYSDPLSMDSNGDGQGDALEWGLSDSGLRTTPLDTNSNGIPDLFDFDNDGDGVPDNKDLSPFTKSTTNYSEATPLQLTLKNLAAGKPTIVEFQIRPQDEKQLWFAYNLLDWPSDRDGQIQDVDNKTYADVASATGRTALANESNGDIKVLPMLEIRIPTASANLPPQSDLTPFNISLNNLTTDGQTQVAYIPLSIESDDKTGKRIAFRGQMRYLPTSSWIDPHQVRLSWVVQGLVDVPCDVNDSEQVAKGCQADGYYHNVAQPIQTYYGNWNLTGLNVREENGTDTATLYEDPAVDNNLKDDAPIWGLAYALEGHFTAPKDLDNDGRRDLTIADFPARFDRDNNPTEAQRFGISNTLQVVTGAFATIDQALASLSMTNTTQILSDSFKLPVQNDRAIKPLIFFAQEYRTRQLNLDMLAAGGNFVSQSSANLTMDMAPSGETPLPVNVMASLKWLGYCASESDPLTFAQCEDDVYWDALEARYAALPALPDDEDPEWMGARLQLAELYYTSLRAGYSRSVQSGFNISTLFIGGENENQTTTMVRDLLRLTASLPLLAAQTFNRIVPTYDPSSGNSIRRNPSILEYAKTLRSELKRVQNELNNRQANAQAKQVSKDLRTFKSQLTRERLKLLNFGLAIAGAAAAILMVTFQIVSIIPSLPAATRSGFGWTALALSLAINVVVPVLMYAPALIRAAQGGLQALAKTVTTLAQLGSGLFKILGVVGLVLGLAATWAFFIYSAVTSGQPADSPGIRRAAAGAIAATVVAVLLFVLAFNPIGLIIGLIIGAIDALLTIFCEAGVSALRNVPGQEGACFTLTGTAINYITKLIYSYDLMVNLDRSDLMLTDIPQISLTNPAKGYVVGNSLSISLPVTTTIMHKNPDPNNGVIIYSYMYLFSQDNLKRSTFNYSLSKNGNDTPAAALDQMNSSWQNVRQRNEAEGGKYLLSPMYRADTYSFPAPLTGMALPVGINATIPFTLNMGYAIPAYECWTVLIVPVCYIRQYKGDNHVPINSLVYDVLPATLDEFLALGTKPDSGLGLSWDARFPSLRDADGDGLVSFAYNGLDPNDGTVDADNDGLTDSFEVEQQGGGTLFSPIQRDTDADGLTDFQEVRLGTDPAIADSDNDGLKDGEEVYHLRYDPNSGLPTTTWEGGWDVTINATTPFVVRVSSDPSLADSDNDGVSDQAERQLAQSANPADRLDNQNRPYHPGVINTPPLVVFIETNDADNYLKPGQALIYTSTVVANTAVVSGVLNLNVPTVLGSAVNPLALGFNPLTFNTAQTVTQGVNLAVASNALTQQTYISSTASTRLPNTGSAGWDFVPTNAEAPLAIAAPFLTLTDLSASRPDRQDNYLLSTVALQFFGSSAIGSGDILGYAIPSGTVSRLEDDLNNTTAFMHNAIPSLATNANGDTMAVWGERSQCNSVTFNSLKVVTAGSDHGTSGIEPFLSFQQNNGGEEQIWYWTSGTGGGNDVTSDRQFGPNADGFPITRAYCSNGGTIRVYESDGPVNDPAQNTLIDTNSVLVNGTSRTITATNGDQTIEVSITVPPIDRNSMKGKIIGADGTVKRTLTFPASPVPTNYQRVNYAPAVASDGSGFLVAYETFTETELVNNNQTLGLPQLVVQGFDKDGNALNNSYRQANSVQVDSSNIPSMTVDVAWIGNSYRLVWQDRRLQNVYLADVPANGASIGTPIQVTSSAAINIERDEAPKVAYDPLRNRSIVVYLTPARGISSSIYQGSTVVTSSSLGGQWYAPQVVWNPIFPGWLLGSQSNSNRSTHSYFSLDSSGAQLFDPISLPLVATLGNSLACPAPQSAAVVDLRVEELPGATSFADASGRGNHATCSGSSCPAAGFSGAPNAPLSDYAVQFDGVDDGLTISRTVQDSFTIAFWLKAPTSSGVQMLVDGGSPLASGFQIVLNNGALTVNAGPNVQQSGRIDDGQWHFVTVNRNAATGRLEAYVDGNRVINAFGTAGITLNGVSDLRIGKSRSNDQPLRATLDHLQIIPAALAQDAVQALFNRTNQSYCVTAGASGSNLYWAKVQASQPDVRGGRISASNGLSLTIDSNLPTASFTALTNNEVVAPGLVIGGSASDATSGVALVEVSVNNGAWTAAAGAESWAFSLAGYSGAISLQVRATDNVGNVGNASATINLVIDSAAPVLSITALTAPVKPTKNAAGRWQVSIAGTASDAASGVKADSLLVALEPQTSNIPLQSEQTATVSGNNWSINYLLNDSLFDPTGVYSLTVQATDNIGNRATPATSVVRLDARAPEAQINSTDLARTVISDTLTISGIVSDTDSLVGIDKLEIAFASLEQLAALPTELTSEQAEALLNRTWTPVTLASRGAGVATTTWSYQLPAGLENSYQIDLRGTDMLGNVAISSNLWRGIIDTTNPRVVMTATDTGVSYFDAASNSQQRAIRFLCAAVDRQLDQDTFVCPGESLATATRSYTSTAELQALFPDLTIVNGLAISYTAWTTTTTPVVAASACDTLGRCTQARTTGAIVAASETLQAAALQAIAAPGAPTAVIVNPTNDSFVAGSGATTSAISVTVAAEAGAGLKEVTIKLDNVTVQTLSFAQSPAMTRTLRTVNVAVASEGQHTLVAQASAWDNSTQTTLFPVVFTLDQNTPSLTIDASALTLADTWQAQSGILRFNGNASDTLGLAAVQIREGNNEFSDATFGGGTWRVALPVADPEGRTLNITVRAIDRAGRITQLNQALATDLSAADAPDSTISSGPANPSNINNAQFVFTGSATAAVFECSLDNGVYTPCASPTDYSDLSKGSHLFRVRAIDGRGLPDLTPAEYSWNINASQPDATITGKPTNPTTERTAVFTFTGDATATRFECSLDGGAYTACTSPKSYNNLGNGEHTFLVRARNSANQAGAADRYLWMVLNLVPVANNQTVIVIPNQAKAITLAATDNEPLLYTVVSPPKSGLLSGEAPTLVYAPNTNYGGVDSFTFKASDGLSESNVATVTLFVDNTPPTVTCSAAPNRLWPPNHSLAAINATVTVSDEHSGPAGFTLVSVVSSEPDRGLNKDDLPNDIQGWTLNTPDVNGQLRAERSDSGSGRLYTLTYRGKDVAGNTALCRTIVFAPRDQTQPQPPPPVLASDLTRVTEVVLVDAPVATPETESESVAINQVYLPVVVATTTAEEMTVEQTPQAAAPQTAAPQPAAPESATPEATAPDAEPQGEPTATPTHTIYLPLLNQ